MIGMLERRKPLDLLFPLKGSANSRVSDDQIEKITTLDRLRAGVMLAKDAVKAVSVTAMEALREGVAFIGFHVEEEGDYGIALPAGVTMHVLTRGGHDDHGHGDGCLHDDHGHATTATRQQVTTITATTTMATTTTATSVGLTLFFLFFSRNRRDRGGVGAPPRGSWSSP